MGTTINKIGNYGDKCGVGQSVSHQRNRALMGIYYIYILGDQKCSTLFNHDSLVMCKLDGNRGMPRMPQPLATCPNSLDNDGVNMFNMFS
jgi:hypothetical protein